MRGGAPPSSLALAVEEGGGDRQSTVSEDIGLAYMNMGHDEQDQLPIEGESEKQREARLSKHVRFGKETEFVEPAPEPPYMNASGILVLTGNGPQPPRAPFRRSTSTPWRTSARSTPPRRERSAANSMRSTLARPRVRRRRLKVQTQGNWEFATPAPRTPQKTSPENQYAPPPQAQYSPPANQYSPPPQNQYSPPANQNQYSPPAGQPPTNREPSPLIPPAAPFARKATLDNVPPNREPSPLIPPVVPSLRKATLDNAPGHQSTPSWDAPAPAPAPSPVQPTPSQPGHHTTPSWAISPAPSVDRDGTGSPISPRIDSPYRAPFATRSTSSLNTQPPPGARTISAAAFRRPQKTGTGDGMRGYEPIGVQETAAGEPVPAGPHRVGVTGGRRPCRRPNSQKTTLIISAHTSGTRRRS
ncbi:hypothetical protein B0H14DRAFT_1018201 [Mycena olivaceomarginata]|nr:hypothetical protein B0H14DRAFT_1018201 [Mycena olivaceomarginata]